MADPKTHYVVAVSIEKVTRTPTGQVYRGEGDDRSMKRTVTELAKIAVKAATLDEAKDQATQHIAIIQDGEFD